MKKLITLLFATTSFASASLADDIVVTSWGGSFSAAQWKGTHVDWIKESGHNIIPDSYSGGLAEIKAQVETGNIKWDVVDVGMQDAVRGCDEGLFEPITVDMLPPAPDGTPASADFFENSLTDCSVPSVVASHIFAYDPKHFPNGGPQSWADFFDVEKFPGKRGLRSQARPVLQFALIADGVDPKDATKVLATEEGLDRAFAKLDTIKDHVVWWKAGAQPPQLLADGEVVMTHAYNGRIFNAVANEGKDWTIVWDGQVYDYDHWVILKGTKKLEAAKDFVIFSTTTEMMINQARYIAYGPARRSAASVPVTFHSNDSINMLDHMPTAPQNMVNAAQNDFEFWADNSEEIDQRFSTWFTKG